MNHPSKDIWSAYVSNRLDIVKSQQIEVHLYECDECMALYLEAVNESEEWKPMSSEQEQALTLRVMEHIGNLPEEVQLPLGGTTKAKDEMPSVHKDKRRKSRSSLRTRRSNSRYIRQTIWNCVIAVCFMLLLMSAGVFERIAAQPSQWQSELGERKVHSMTESIMAKTASFIEAIVDHRNIDQSLYAEQKGSGWKESKSENQNRNEEKSITNRLFGPHNK